MAKMIIPDDSIAIKNARLAVAAELRKKKYLKQPIARYDHKTGEIYMEQGDGTRKIVGKSERKRYSERQH